MVMAAKQNDGHRPTSGRYLDQEKVRKALDAATAHGASYAEVRVVALTESTVAMRDGVRERATPGQELGMTLRVLADGAWGVHSTTDIASLTDQIESTTRLAKAVAQRSDMPRQCRFGLQVGTNLRRIVALGRPTDLRLPPWILRQTRARPGLPVN